MGRRYVTHTTQIRSGVGALRIVRETRRPAVEIARDLGIGAGTVGSRVRKDRIERGEAGGLSSEDRGEAGGLSSEDRGEAGGLSSEDRGELVRLRRRGADLEMERDVLKRSVVLWVKEATR